LKVSQFNIRKLKVGGPASFGDHAFVDARANALDRTNLQGLASELAKLRIELKACATTPDQANDADTIQAAEVAAHEGKGMEALSILSKVGTWVLKIATEIGVPIAVTALKEALDLSAT
jgi:hypothetical protein